jgi:hypothetical protein
MNWENYEPTTDDIRAEAELQAFMGWLRPWQTEQIEKQAEIRRKAKQNNGTAEYHPLERVP